MSNRKLRQEAKERGDQWFEPEGPCHVGHFDVRSVATGKCRECTRATGRRFYKYKKGTTENAKMIARGKKAREEAIARGDIMYKSGKPCPNGHQDPWRYITAYNCVECNTEKQKQINAERRKQRTSLPKKPRGRPKKVAAPTQPTKITITEEERKDDSFAEIVRRVYERDRNW